MDGIFISIFRTLASFGLLIIITLLVGKHINAHKTHYSFALSITIGSIIANMAFDTAIPFVEILASFLTIFAAFYIFLTLSSRSRSIRKWFSGTPTVLVENGKILEGNMKKIKLSLDDLDQRLREAGVFDLGELEYVLLEVSGQLSIQKKNINLTVTKKDLNIPYDPSSLPRELIMDGKLVDKNLNQEFNSWWIQQECEKRNVKISDVYYAVVNSNGTLFMDFFKDNLQSPSDVE
ncbi:DUF421 domain-containing protein [Halobacillus fulvus]|nr:DUF421 domain-containing protein [Halobacillus fulvus]